MRNLIMTILLTAALLPLSAMPKLKVGGAYLGKYVDYIKGWKDFETTFDDNGAGVSIS